MEHQTKNDEIVRLIAAFALSAVVFFVWIKFFAPESPPTRPVESPAPAERVERPEPTALEGPEIEPSEGEADEIVPTGERIEAGERQELVVEIGVARVIFLNRGAVPISWTLPDYEGYSSSDPVELVNRRAFLLQRFPFQIHLREHPEIEETLSAAFWKLEEEDLPGGGRRVVFRFADGSGLEAEKTFRFRRGSYLVEVEAEVLQGGEPVEPIEILWGPGIANHPKEVRSNRYFQRPHVIAMRGEDFDRWTDPEDSPELAASSVSWAGVDDQYFAALAIPGGARVGFRYWEPGAEGERSEGDEADDFPAPILAVPIERGGGPLTWFIGPKKLQVLQGLEGGDFARVIEFGSIIGVIARWLLLGLLWIHEHVVANYGWAIIFMTVLIRLLFFPLTQRSMRKMREMSVKMKKIQPELKALRAKYKEVKDMRKRQKIQEEMMAVQRREGINPADQISGCLPMLLQMPIFFAFFRMLPAAIELRKEPWILWIRDLSQPDPLFVTPLLMGIAMFFSTRRSMSQQAAGGGAEGFQKQIFFAMPIVFTVICFWAPSGLVLYWLFSNLIQMGQQELLRRSMADQEGDGEADDKSKKKKKGGSGGKKKGKGRKGKKG